MTFHLKPQIYIKTNVTKREQEAFFQPRCSSHIFRSCSWEETFHFRDTRRTLRWGQPCLVQDRIFLTSTCSPRRDHQFFPCTPRLVIDSLPAINVIHCNSICLLSFFIFLHQDCLLPSSRLHPIVQILH